MTSKIVELLSSGEAIVEHAEDVLGADVTTRRYLGPESLALLLDGSTPVRGFCRASDALVAAGFWNESDGELTKAGDEAREFVRRNTADCSICRRRHGFEIVHAAE